MSTHTHILSAASQPGYWAHRIQALLDNTDCAADILSIHLLPENDLHPARLQIILFELSLPWLQHQRHWCQKHLPDQSFNVELLSYTDFVDWLQREPLSLLYLQQTGQVLYGENLFESLLVIPENLRQELEKKLSQERLWFRRHFLRSPSEALAPLLHQARQRFKILEQGLIFLRTQSATLPTHWLVHLYGLEIQAPQILHSPDLQTHLELCWQWDLFLSHVQQKLGQMFESSERDTQGMLTL